MSLKITTIGMIFLLSAGQAISAAGAPVIGGGAKIAVTIGKAGVINAVAMITGVANIKQSVGSIIDGNIAGTLDINVQINKAGVLNVGGMVEGTATICQSIGTVGDNCMDSITGGL